MAFDPLSIRRQFPIFGQAFDGHPLVYLDHAATSQKPDAVLHAMEWFYSEENANAHRGMHILAERATVAFEEARKTVASFLGAKRPEEIIFTKNCTEGINLVARSWGKKNLKKGDAVVLTIFEHHSNIVPWLQLKEEMGIDVLWIDADKEGRLNMDQLDGFLKTGNVKLVSVTSQSNVLGTRPDLPMIIKKAHAAGALVLIDGAQLIAHAKVDVTALDCDFFTFSGHKVYGPTGIGVLYGKQKLLEAMPPFLGGGMMIQNVTKDGFTAADIPAKFEAGTQPVAEAVGLKAAIDWLSGFSWSDREAHDQMLIARLYEVLKPIDGLKIIGPADPKDTYGCVSFTVDGVHPHDLTEILGRQGICLRAGHHCAQPLHRHLELTATSRASVGLYNTKEDIDALGPAITEALSRLRR